MDGFFILISKQKQNQKLFLSIENKTARNFHYFDAESNQNNFLK